MHAIFNITYPYCNPFKYCLFSNCKTTFVQLLPFEGSFLVIPYSLVSGSLVMNILNLAYYSTLPESVL